MLILIIGGSASGKSEMAENTSMKLADCYKALSSSNRKMLYIATMKPFDDECLKRIERHRQMRSHKGFATEEIYQGLTDIVLDHYDVILLECMSNMLANEMYSIYPPNDNCVDKIILGVDKLMCNSENTIIVSNEVFCDGDSNSEETLLYIKQLGEINRRIAQKADVVIEAVCGIPIYHKGRLEI